MKRVRFNDNPQVYYIPAVDESRDGRFYLIDKMRFQKRIEQSEKIIDKCLKAKLQIIEQTTSSHTEESVKPCFILNAPTCKPKYRNTGDRN